MQHDTIKNNLKNGIVEKSIEVLRYNGMDNKAIKKKIIESFSLNEETINKLFNH